MKERKKIKREELEGFLKSAAEEVKKKTKSELFDIEIEYEEKHKHGAERAKFEIEIKWEKSPEPAFQQKPEISETKQAMKAIQKESLLQVDSNAMPDISKINTLVELNKIFISYSKGKAWESELLAFAPKLQEFKNAINENNLEKAKTLAHEISALKKACHQKHINKNNTAP